MNKNILNALRSAFSAYLLSRAAAKTPKTKTVAPLIHWVERRSDYYLDGHGSVRRSIAKKPADLSARQWKKTKKEFRRQAKLHPGMEPARIGGKLMWIGPDVMTGQPLSEYLQRA